MNANESSDEIEHQPTKLSSWIILGIGIIAFMFVIDDLLGRFNGGGIFSLSEALSRAKLSPAAIDVDSAALRVPIMSIVCVPVITVAYALKANLNKRLVSFAVIMTIIGGGFIFDGIYGESVITNLMLNRGYVRCSIRDHDVGVRKSRVWFANYVRDPETCPAQQRPAP